ncbi:exodeoxyribonuclease VII small subunit [Subtercola boreus]|uniref:Exodeoxyribonuclease 7 small subunit n=1 Tax=Subtercola boreus TaxID=120213 RepID=A0A3E0VWE8_9MICO|nr:exodeoxyribonuclease VII small subunit [Subtercola boreus]RFA14081.1 exodeoxyribonuclease VII small subunit [Subtercola boreus]
MPTPSIDSRDVDSRAVEPGAGAGAAAGTSALSYEEARDELVRVVNELERGASTLEQSLALWERGEALAARCEEWLIGAKTRLDAARASASTKAE